MRVLIAGGGIGGLTTAIALRHHGIDALVLEQAEVMAEIGAGIQIASNAAIVLREIGLESAIRAVGVKPQSYDYRDLRTGRMLYQAPLGDEAAARYGAPMYNVHRADLIQILFDAVPSEARRLAARVAAVSQDADGVEVRPADRRNTARRCAGRLRRYPFGGAPAFARQRGKAFCQHPDVAIADPRRAAGGPWPRRARQLLVRPRPHADHLLGTAEESLQHPGLGAGPRGAAGILDRERRHLRDAGLVRRCRAARPRHARTVQERLHHRHVLPRSDRQLDLRPRHAARRRRASDGAISRRRRRPEHRGCLDVCAGAGAPAARRIRRAAGISAPPSAAHHPDPGRCARRRQADA